MKELIEALQIFLKYKDEKYPFHCEHDELTVCGYDEVEFSEADLRRLSELGFDRVRHDYDINEGEDDFNPKSENWTGLFHSYKYGSC